jgi:hypothetical protein
MPVLNMPFVLSVVGAFLTSSAVAYIMSGVAQDRHRLAGSHLAERLSLPGLAPPISDAGQPRSQLPQGGSGHHIATMCGRVIQSSGPLGPSATEVPWAATLLRDGGADRFPPQPRRS